MSSKSITFRLAAYSEAAGKYNPDAPRDGNEDNFYIDDDLSDNKPGNCQPDKEVTMSDCGCLMVVADGMGGMNAGEVASEIAIKTVEEHFAPGKITPKIATSKEERKSYLERVIKDADRNVKLDARNNPDHAGMGSTIILVWIVGNHATVSWCGDSRAYRFNPVNGIEPLSRDHSYVQELVNRGEIPYEATFDHPQNNIVTRSLGDPNNAARPETRDFELYNGDIILVCSDGLSGVLRDRKTLTPDNSGNYYPGENIEDIIRGHQSSMIDCKNALMIAAQNADWYDNVTVLLCQILGGAAEPVKKLVTKPQGGEKVKRPDKLIPKVITKRMVTIIAIAILFILWGFGCFFLGIKYDSAKEGKADVEMPNPDILPEDSTEIVKDSVQVVATEPEAERREKDTTANGTSVGQNTEEEILTEDSKLREYKNAACDTLEKYSQDLLKKVVENAITLINESKNKDEADGVLEEIQKRKDILDKLKMKDRSQLDSDSQLIYDTLKVEIADPKCFKPTEWGEKIEGLKEELTES